MAARDVLSRAEPRRSLPVLERLAPPPPPEIVAARIESHTRPGDVIADLHGRGGWIARAGLDRQRRALSVESSPLTRLLAEIVLRPPDIRHLDAAFQAIGGSPHGALYWTRGHETREASTRAALGDEGCAFVRLGAVADDVAERPHLVEGRRVVSQHLEILRTVEFGG